MRRLLSAALLVVAAACGNDSISGTGSVAGTYYLESVGGQSLPVVVQTATSTRPRIELLSDILVLDRGNSWSESVQVRETSPSGFTQIRSSDDGGFYSLNGSTIVIEYDVGDPDVGTVRNDGTITFADGTGSSVFRRQ